MSVICLTNWREAKVLPLFATNLKKENLIKWNLLLKLPLRGTLFIGALSAASQAQALPLLIDDFNLTDFTANGSAFFWKGFLDLQESSSIRINFHIDGLLAVYSCNSDLWLFYIPNVEYLTEVSGVF